MMMNLDSDRLQRLMRDIVTTRPLEIGCDDCFSHLDQFVELTLAGQPAATIMPFVHEHLLRCPNCREEYDALLLAIRASFE